MLLNNQVILYCYPFYSAPRRMSQDIFFFHFKHISDYVLKTNCQKRDVQEISVHLLRIILQKCQIERQILYSHFTDGKKEQRLALTCLRTHSKSVEEQVPPWGHLSCWHLSPPRGESSTACRGEPCYMVWSRALFTTPC